MGHHGVFMIVIVLVSAAVSVAFAMGRGITENHYERNCEEFGAISFVSYDSRVTVYECRVKK